VVFPGWMLVLNIVLGIIFFSATVFAGIALGKRLCASLEPFSDGPAPATPPIPWMYGISAVTGACVGFHAGTPEPAALFVLAFGALLSGCFMSIWYCDTRCGIVPDWLTLPALVLVVAYSLFCHNMLAIISAVALFVPFAYTAYRSKGLGMGWGDAKLVALGGAALGGSAFLSTIVACLVMAVHAKITNRMREPIAFAPYLIIGFECALAWLHA
jgi:prepilin signal peptidase PulO-like enzyme (type II secretory pathway)